MASKDFREWLVESGRIIRFGIVGVCVTLVYVIAFLTATEGLGISAVRASILGQVAAIGISYIGHSVYSFRVRTNHRLFVWRFALIALLSFIVASSLTWLVVDGMKLSSRVAALSVAVIIPAINYLCNRLWVFAPGLDSAVLDQTKAQGSNLKSNSR